MVLTDLFVGHIVQVRVSSHNSFSLSPYTLSQPQEIIGMQRTIFVPLFNSHFILTPLPVIPGNMLRPYVADLDLEPQISTLTVAWAPVPFNGSTTVTYLLEKQRSTSINSIPIYYLWETVVDQFDGLEQSLDIPTGWSYWFRVTAQVCTRMGVRGDEIINLLLERTRQWPSLSGDACGTPPLPSCSHQCYGKRAS